MPDQIIEIADSATPEDWKVASLRIDARKWAEEQKSSGDALPSVVPELDDKYWFGISKSMVENANSSRLSTAKTVQTMIGWLWGVYTAGAVIGISLAEKAFPFSVTLLIAAPVPMLLGAYWLSVWAQAPKSTKFDRRIPDDIKRSYYEAVESRSKRLNVAIGVSFGAALTVAVAIVAGSVSKQSSTAEVTQGFQVHKIQTEDSMSLLIEGKFRSFQTVEFEITETLTTGSTSTSNISYNTPESGALEITVPVVEGGKTYTLIGSWNNRDGSVQTLERKMAIGPSGDPQ